MMYVCQIIMLYTLNLFNAVCQLYLNKTGRKKNTFQLTVNLKARATVLFCFVIPPKQLLMYNF